MQQGLQEDLGAQDLLADGREVVNADRAATGLAGVPVAAVVPVGLHLQATLPLPVPLWTVGHRELAGRQAGRVVEHIEHGLPDCLPRSAGRFLEQPQRQAAGQGMLLPGYRLHRLASLVGGPGHMASICYGQRRGTIHPCGPPASWPLVTSCSAASRSTPTPTGDRKSVV